MKATCEETSSTVTKINIEIPADTVNSMLEDRYRKLAKTAKIAGFRKGKVPRSVLVSKYQASVTSDVLNTLIPESVNSAIRDNSIRAVSQPVVDKVRLEEGVPLSFEATVEVIPKFKLKDFSDTELSCKIPKVNDESVNEVVERLRDSLGALEPADTKAVEKGDHILISHQCSVDGQEVPKLNAAETSITVGSNHYFEAVELGVTGMKKGETKEFTFNLPDNFHMKGIAGKEAVFSVTVNEVKQKRLPELNDEFAKQVGKGETLEELKSSIKEDLEKSSRHHAMMITKQTLLEKLVASNIVDIPEVLKRSETERLLHERTHKTLSDKEKERGEAELRAEMEEQAINSLSKEMIIDSFTEEHGIRITEEELSLEMKSISSRVGQSSEVFSRRLKEDQRAYANFEQRLLNEKTLDAMLEKVNVEETFFDPESSPASEENHLS